MKKIILAIGICAIALSLSFTSAATKVYICTGKYAVAYHSTSSCSGLNKCKGTIKSVTLAEAQRLKRRACKVCY
jgi:hypothetical protein